MKCNKIYSSIIVGSAFLLFGGLDTVSAQKDGDIVMDSESPILPFSTSNQISSAGPSAQMLSGSGAFESFNADHDNTWKANIDKKSGVVRVLSGGVSKNYATGQEYEGDGFPSGPEGIAQRFLMEEHEIFGLGEDLSDLRTERVDETPGLDHVRLQQTVHGVPVSGAVILVHTDKNGGVAMVQNEYRKSLQIANQRVLPQETAEQIAMDDLKIRFGADAEFGNITAEELIVPYKGEFRFVWNLKLSVKPLDRWGYQIDAESGEILDASNLNLNLTKGKGTVYKSNKDYHKDKAKYAPLKNMYSDSEDNDDGRLWGLHADVYDYDELDFTSEDLRFKIESGASDFDRNIAQTTAYYNLENLWDWWQSKVVKKYGPTSPDHFNSLDVPVLVNGYDGWLSCNAYYTPELADYGTPGFAFGNEDTCTGGNEDLALDQGVWAHEYAHAMMDWCGFDTQFGGSMHNYGRSMGEGNSDWFAYLFDDNTELGNVVFAPIDSFFRDLDNTRTYPDDVNFPSWGTPEEHYTGEIWGGFLYDISQVLKGKALEYVYQSYFYFTNSGGLRNGESDFVDAMYTMVIAESTETDWIKNSLKVWGAQASRGINGALRPTYSHDSNYFGTGSAGSDDVYYFLYNFPPVKSADTTGRVLNSGDRHEYPINILESGMKLTVSVKGSSPTLELYGIDGMLQASGKTSGKKASLDVSELYGSYVITVEDKADTKYKLSVKVK